jgi:hypothetical protein
VPYKVIPGIFWRRRRRMLRFCLNCCFGLEW